MQITLNYSAFQQVSLFKMFFLFTKIETLFSRLYFRFHSRH
uniref:Uncharacterized protein n=1 Tax=Anguilla anguilla TaxID=7936 RepID=A0A0E9RZC6_ANGAN